MIHDFVHPLLVAFMAILLAGSCEEVNPNQNTYSAEVSSDPEMDATGARGYDVTDTVYVPVYSDIYSQGKHLRFLLTSTLSIRNPSYTDTIVVNKIEYFDTRGNMVRAFIDHPIYVLPMATVEYVIDESDKSGGSGANFIVMWSAKNEYVKTVIQSVMISVSGQQGVAFSTDGVSVSRQQSKADTAAFLP